MEINPTKPQDKFIFSEAQYPAFVGGFGSGKTEALLVRSIINKIRYPSNDRAFYEPTYDLIRMIAWPRFEEMLSSLNVPYRLVKSPHNVLEIEGCGKIIFRSMDNPQRIIGYQVADSDVDELDTLKKADAEEVWRRVLSRNRQLKPDGSLNTVGVATTPEGFRFVYDAWELNPRDGYEIIRAPTSSNPHLPKGYIKSLEDMYPKQLLQAYVEGQFVNLTSGQVYTSFDRVKCNADILPSEHEPLFIGMDFNVGNMSAVIHVKRQGKPIAVGEIAGAYDTPDICRIIKARYPNNQIQIYPDASGGSRDSNNAAQTDLAVLRQHGFNVRAKKRNPFVKDRVNSMNAAFESGYLVSVDACPEYTRCLEQQAYNKNNEPDKTQNNDHLNDAAGYFIEHEYGINKAKITEIQQRW
ncbi:MAG: phage terminase large subunit [Pseudomonadota bacterium]|nr:phage terminase large subunit [Pseudomonadota bacterium]